MSAVSLGADAIARHGAELHAALRSGVAVEPLSERIAGLSLGDAYAISNDLLARRLADGERVVG